MSEVKAGLKVKVEADGATTLDEVNAKLEQVGKTAQSVSVQLKGLKELWASPATAKGGWSDSARIGMSAGKAMVEILGKQVSAMADAVTAPAKSSYAGALSVANSYRDSTQRISTSTRRDYYEISAQIDSASRRLGLLPDRVQQYGRSVRAMTGDWGKAMMGLDAYQNRALKTDQTLEEMIPTAASLANVFGIQSTDQVNRFFGTIDRQASSARVSAELTQKAFMDMSDSLSQITSADTSKLTAVTATFLEGAGGNQARAERRMGGMNQFMAQHGWWFEQRAKAAGALKKGESYFDDQGLVKDDKYLDMIEFMQKEAKRVSRGKVTGDVVSYLTAIEGMPREVAAGLMNFDVGKARTRASMQGTAEDTTGAYLQTGAGSRDVAEANKRLKDIGLGNGLLGAQDKAVAMGGGAAGIAMAASGEVFSKATGVFWDSVNIFAGAAKGAGGGAVSSGVGAGIGASVASAGRAAWGLASRLSPLALLASVATMEGDKAPGSDGERPEDLEAELAERQKKGGGRYTYAYSDEELKDRISASRGTNMTPATAEMSMPSQFGGAPNRSSMVVIDQSSIEGIGAATAKQMEGKTLRTQSIQPPENPPGMSPPA